MEANKIQNVINELNYSDAKVLNVSCNYFADEVIIIYEDLDAGNVSYNFVGCYEVSFKHCINLDKFIPIKEMKYSQLPYFIQNVDITDIIKEKERFFKCNITMIPLQIEIICRGVKVGRVNGDDCHWVGVIDT